MSALALLLSLVLAGPAQDDRVVAALERAGDNRSEIAAALERVPIGQREGMRWLVEHMPANDLRSLDAEFLLENCDLAYRAWREAPWRETVSEEVFFDAVLPYASINERRERWRAEFHERLGPLVAEAESPAEAAAILNNEIFDLLGVKYSTKRPKADQSPLESIDAGLASCTGLTVMLIDACRSVGVPARFVGTPLWSDGSGNHSWVEVWDEGWHFTGAAEPTGMELDRGWFAGRAATARSDDPRHAIYATTWRLTPLHFPMVWAAGDQSVRAVDVTSRYTTSVSSVPEGMVRVRFRVRDATTGERCAAELRVTNGEGGEVFAGTSNDERFDGNDHLTAALPLGAQLAVVAELGDHRAQLELEVERDEQLVELTLAAAPNMDSSEALEALREHLEVEGTLDGVGAQPFARVPLTAGDVAAAEELLWSVHVEHVYLEREAEFESRKLTLGDKVLPFWYEVFGDKPEGGRSLFLSMHGGGGAPPTVNDQQWHNQKGLYAPAEGVYLAPRAATDTWNLWHQAHIDVFFDRLIADLQVFEEIDTDRVYLLGYSAGGDGVFQLAPRMADRFAAAAMMAGHPNETQPDGLRNLPFTLHMGGKDSAYDRNAIAGQWKEKLAALRAGDPDGYEHWVEIYADKGHWMDGRDEEALPWMAAFTRNLRPERIVWLQDDVTHARFYWLAVDEPRARSRVVVEREGQTIRVIESGELASLRFRLDDVMFDLEQEVVVRAGEQELFRGVVPRTIEVLARTLTEREDRRALFPAELVCELREK